MKDLTTVGEIRDKGIFSLIVIFFGMIPTWIFVAIRFYTDTENAIRKLAEGWWLAGIVLAQVVFLVLVAGFLFAIWLLPAVPEPD